jgi:pantetheine-phosphate adenylyltransferase
MPTKPRKYRKVALGGTFDQFHKGHIKLINKALEIGDNIIIGLTTDGMLKEEPKLHTVANYEEREKDLTDFLRKNNALKRTKIIPLTDPYGPTLSDGEIEALVVSLETAKRAEKINKLRAEKGLKPLKIVAINMILAEDIVPISTTRIKNGEIDREGHIL